MARAWSSVIAELEAAAVFWAETGTTAQIDSTRQTRASSETPVKIFIRCWNAFIFLTSITCMEGFGCVGKTKVAVPIRPTALPAVCAR